MKESVDGAKAESFYLRNSLFRFANEANTFRWIDVEIVPSLVGEAT